MHYTPLKVGGKKWLKLIERLVKANPGEKIKATKALQASTGCGLRVAVEWMYLEYS